MYLVDPSSIRRERLLGRVASAILCGGVTLAVVWALMFLVGKRDVRVAGGAAWPRIDYACIGRGGLSLKPVVRASAIEPLMEELAVVGSDGRPDGSALRSVCLALKNSGGREEVVCGQKIFLERGERGYFFSSNATPMAVTPLSVVERGVVLRVEIGDVKEDVVVSPSILFQKSLESEEYLQLVQESKLWGPDLFLQQWGGDDYRLLSGKQKVEIGGKIYFLTVGDTLWWDGMVWKAGKAALNDTPTLRVVSANGLAVKAEVWDGNGYNSREVEICLSPPPQNSLKHEQIMTAVRSRYPTEVTCQLGKRRVTIKEGDWWVHCEGRWRPLKSHHDLEAFLAHDFSGELYIFEKIEAGREKITLKGRAFDKMRTSSEPVTLVFNPDRKNGRGVDMAGAPRPQRQKFATRGEPQQ